MFSVYTGCPKINATVLKAYNSAMDEQNLTNQVSMERATSANLFEYSIVYVTLKQRKREPEFKIDPESLIKEISSKMTSNFNIHLRKVPHSTLQINATEISSQTQTI